MGSGAEERLPWQLNYPPVEHDDVLIYSKIMFLTAGSCPKMKVLDLSRCHLKSKGFGYILRGLKNGNLLRLESVMLKGNGIGARGIAYLKEAFESSALDRLKLFDLSENEVCDEGKFKFSIARSVIYLLSTQEPTSLLT